MVSVAGGDVARAATSAEGIGVGIVQAVATKAVMVRAMVMISVRIVNPLSCLVFGCRVVSMVTQNNNLSILYRLMIINFKVRGLDKG